MTEQSARDDMIAASGVYGLLARLWHREIDAELLSVVGEEPLRSNLESLGLQIPSSDDETIENLATDYCRIFIGPRGHIPPHQSVFRDGLFQGDLVGSLNDYIEIIGQPTIELDNQMTDHIAFEFALMQRVLSEAEHCSDDRLPALQNLVDQFFADHIRWIADYCQSTASLPRTDFYRSLLAMTQEFLLS